MKKSFIGFIPTCVLLTASMLWGNPSLEWNASVGGVIFSSPAIASDGTVYVGSNDNKLHAFNSDGSTKWTFTTGNWVDSTPSIGSDGTVHVGSWDNKLYALNPTDGSKQWDFNTSSSIIASPAIGSNGNLYFGSKDYFFYALDSSGNKLWEYFAGQPVSSSAACLLYTSPSPRDLRGSRMPSSA